MIGILIFLALIVVIIMIYVGGAFSWCLSKLRLLIPVIFFLICGFLHEQHADWLITKILFYNLPFTEDFPVMDLIFSLMVLYAVIMFFHDIFAPIIKKIQNARSRKQQSNEIAAQKQLEKEAIYNTLIRKQENQKRESLVFSIMPDMEKEYYYFKNQCVGDDELALFETDWETYIYEAYRRLSMDETDTYSFEDWYGDNDMWKKRSYNKEFLAKERAERTSRA